MLVHKCIRVGTYLTEIGSICNTFYGKRNTLTVFGPKVHQSEKRASRVKMPNARLNTYKLLVTIIRSTNPLLCSRGGDVVARFVAEIGSRNRFVPVNKNKWPFCLLVCWNLQMTISLLKIVSYISTQEIATFTYYSNPFIGSTIISETNFSAVSMTAKSCWKVFHL